MATFDKRTSPRTGKISWRARIRRTRLPDLTKTFFRKTDAKLWVEETKAAINSGRYMPIAEAQRHTVTNVLDLYEPEILYRLKDPYNRLWHLGKWQKKIGHILLADLKPNDIKAFREELRSKLSDATINRYVASLSAALTYAAKELGWIERNPCLQIKKFKEPRGRTRFLSEDELTRLTGVCDSLLNYPELQSIVLIAITTGMRRGEILNLRWGDCDFKSQRIVIRETKNGDTRAVPLLGPALKALRSWGKVRPLDKHTLIFPSHTKGDSNFPLDIDHAWRLIKKQAGLRDFRFHDLRHTTASYLAMSGAGLREIGDILGHRSLTMVQRYSHLTEDHKFRTVSRMVDDVFGGPI
jgi:integrase